ncbi:MAG: pyridoxamine 5'-phosphate oxidase [Ferruginibacter sp.]|nr:pyridoxamine 5'-phosphate oxidase [Chitinophagaceae bacterium]MBP6287106.1 pyridoxamine 5'-phosphate oxidase [Ferruginibacter sp.]MBU9935785.1 pyridoxamine 5'-phosphate oxidase [Ferruginibacter sp.]HQW93964.1 pyridoxamine 5'-phosphate oxidase [Ferruginibacter sp.]
MQNIADLRTEYKMQTLLEADVDADPVKQFEKWWDDALKSEIYEANAMTLATVDADMVPSARIVLLKGFDEKGFVFFTNYNSQKGSELARNDRACLVFFWKELERQVRITGIAEKISAEESIAYFNSRPDGSKIGAWASPQSLVVAGKAWLKETFDYYMERFKHGEIPRPPHWGGYRVKPFRVEFWQGRPNRLHDRILYTSAEDNSWKIERLAP